MFDYTAIAEITTHNYIACEDDARWIISAHQTADGTILATVNAYSPDMLKHRLTETVAVDPADFSDGLTALTAAVRQVSKTPLAWDCVNLTDAQGSEWILTASAWPEIVRIALEVADVTY